MWDDYDFQQHVDYMKWFFPMYGDDKETRLTQKMIYKFRTNMELRLQVVQIVRRYMNFLGYRIVIIKNKLDVRQFKPIKRHIDGLLIGWYNTDNYETILRILTFLSYIRMRFLNALFFKLICKSIFLNSELARLIEKSGVFRSWINSQPYLKENVYDIEKYMLPKINDAW